MTKLAVFCFLVLCYSPTIVQSLDNGLGLTPAMGWNTDYEARAHDYNDTYIRYIAKSIVDSGLHKLGWEYVNLDATWALKHRDPKGNLIPNPQKFPHGIKALSDYVHSLGLKFGMYTDRGTKMCDKAPGSYGHTTIDANNFAKWGVDYLKEDSCAASGEHKIAFKEYGKMRDALNKTGRPIYFALCGWHTWYAPVGYSLGNSWRIAEDDGQGWDKIVHNIDQDQGLAKYAGAGGWNDLCLLCTHQGDGITLQQSRTQFSMYAVLAAPWLMTGDIGKLDNYTMTTYSNSEVIAVHQDKLGKQGFRVDGLASTSPLRVYGRPLSGGKKWAVVFFNNNPATAHAANVTCSPACMQMMFPSPTKTIAVRDLWTHTNNGTASNMRPYMVEVQPNGGSVTMLFQFVHEG